MGSVISLFRRVRDEEDGHAGPALLSVLAAIGVVALAVGAAEDISWLTYLGGIVAATGIFGFALADHLSIDYDIYGRLEKLEGKPEPIPERSADTGQAEA